MKKKHEVHMLPTEDEGVIMSDVGKFDSQMMPMSEVLEHLRDHERPHNHLYTTSNEEIKRGDHCLWKANGKMYKEWVLGKAKLDKGEWKIARKIIATTDPKLTYIYNQPTKDLLSTEFVSKPIPQIHQDFIKSFCDKGGIWEVSVEYEGIAHPTEKGALVVPKLIDNTIIIHPIEEMDMVLRKQLRNFIRWQLKNNMLKDELTIDYEIAEYYLEEQTKENL